LRLIAPPFCTGCCGRYALIHELWHAEDLVHVRCMHGLPPPPPVPTASPTPTPSRHGGDHQGAEAVLQPSEDGDVEIAGGLFFLGGQRSQRMVFDCEKWEHPVHLQPFRIARWY
jgi:hypothetical protein